MSITGFKLAYDHYLRARLKTRGRKSKFRLKRASLSNVLQKISPSELANRNRIVTQFEFNRTVEALRRHFVETTDSNIFIFHLEMSMFAQREEYIARREVILDLYLITVTFCL